MTAGAPFTAPFTGTYSIAANGRASATFTLQIQGANETLPLRWVMYSNTSARMIGFDDTGSGWGSVDLQAPSSFSGGLSGTYVFNYDGLNNAEYPYAGVGIFTAEGGVISSGLGDFNQQNPDDASIRQEVPISGSYTTVDPTTGRGTWNFTDSLTGYTHSFAFYLINSSSFVFSSTDSGFGELGVAVQQDTSSAFSNSSLSGNSLFISNGYVFVNGNTVSATAAGLLAADGDGNLTSGIVDINGTGNVPTSGTYSISANGHGTMTFQTGGTSNTLGFYMITAQQCYYVSLMPTVVSSGQFMPQASGAYNAATLHGSLAFVLRASYASAAQDMAGQMTSDGAGNLAGTVDVNAAGTLAPDTPITGTYTVSGNGRGDVAINVGSTTTHHALYLSSGRTGFLVPIDPGSAAALGLIYRQF